MSLTPATKALYDREMSAAGHAPDVQARWAHLERAHIVSQPYPWLHTHNHLAMFALAVAQHDRREAFGQFVRIISAAPGGGLPVVEIEQFLHWLRAVGRSQNTVRSYARHLSLFYRWLSARGIGWDTVVFNELCDFVGALSVGLPPLQTWRGHRSAETVYS